LCEASRGQRKTTRSGPHLSLLGIVVEVINEMRIQQLRVEFRVLSWQRTETDDGGVDVMVL
jgi:hypothetical protein